MKKVRKLSFLGILGVVIAVLFLISISFTQSQVKIQKKPPPEPEATWAVRIPTSDPGYMFYGMEDGYYEDNDPNITVSVKKNEMAGPWSRFFNFGYAFDFTITNENVGTGTPPAHVVGFNQVPNLTIVQDDPDTDENEGYPDHDKPCCQFPDDDCAEGGCSSCPPVCMATFLNGTHPHAGGAGEEDYQYFWFRIHIFDQDIELMETGESYLFGDGPDPGEPGDYLSIIARYRQECYQEPAYHDVELYRSINWYRAQTADPPNPQNIEIERLDASTYEIECEAVWRFWVHSDGFLKVKERYCTKVKGKTKWFYPMEAKGNFSFYIDWIKNPGSPTPPEAPSDLTATAPECDQIYLTWTDKSNNEDGFEIERINDSSEVITVGADVTYYSDTGLSENTNYYYRVRAFNNAGDSSYSDTASATTPPCGGTEPPAAPTGLTANARGKAKIALNWTDNSNNEYGFRIYRGSESIASVGPNITSYVDKGLDSKTEYTYKVCSYNSKGENCSSSVSATTK